MSCNLQSFPWQCGSLHLLCLLITSWRVRHVSGQACQREDADESAFFQVRTTIYVAPGVNFSGFGEKVRVGGLKQEQTSAFVNRSAATRKLYAVQDVPAGASKTRKPTESKDTWALTTLDTSEVSSILLILAVILFFDRFIIPLCGTTFLGHIGVLVFMIVCACLFSSAIWLHRGRDDARSWLEGYFLEWSLSMDNLFIFDLTFRTFCVPEGHVPRALTFGIYGALILRALVILLFSHLFSISHVVTGCLGALLIVMGIMSLSEDDDDEVERFYTVRFFKWLFGSRLQGTYDDDGRLFGQDPSTGKVQFTVLFLVINVITVVDIIFAVDSVGAKTGQIKDTYLNLSSSLLAMFGLRALFFVIRDLAHFFELVKYGVCSILVCVGAEMMVRFWVTVPAYLMCFVIGSIFLLSIIASVVNGVLEEYTWSCERSPEDAPPKDRK